MIMVTVKKLSNAIVAVCFDIFFVCVFSSPLVDHQNVMYYCLMIVNGWDIGHDADLVFTP